MADLYTKSRNKEVSLEIDHFRQICKLQTFKIFQKTDYHIQFAVKMSNAAGRLGTHTHKQTTITLVRMHRVLIMHEYGFQIQPILDT